MGSEQQHKRLLFTTEIGGPMTFAFVNVFNIEKNKLSEVIQKNGGEVIEYSSRNKFTIVLTKKNKQSSDEIQFDLKYINDCKEKNEILPLETYRLDKKVNIGCYYSKPLGSTQCIFSKLIHRGRCRKHSIPAAKNADTVDSISADEANLKNQLKFMRNQIFVEEKFEVKSELLIPDESMEDMQESQSFVDETYYETDQNTLWSQEKRRAPVKRVKKKPRTKRKSRTFKGGSRRLRARH